MAAERRGKKHRQVKTWLTSRAWGVESQKMGPLRGGEGPRTGGKGFTSVKKIKARKVFCNLCKTGSCKFRRAYG